MHIIRFGILFMFCLLSWPTEAADSISEEESQRYFFGLMQKAKTFRVHPGAAPNYLHGVWRLDRKAHVGGGHYARADKGDDVTLISNRERLVQVDFNRHSNETVEFTGLLSDLTDKADGSMHFGKEKRFLVPLDENHLAVTRYDYIVVLERVSGPPDRSAPSAFPVEQGPASSTTP